MRKKRFSYNPKLKEYAKQMRNAPTFAEKALWYSLKGKQLGGYDFDRQKPIGEFIFDFFSSELKLVIEVDGLTHDLPKVIENDKMKDQFVKSIGLNILRFTDEEVIYNGEKVIKRIMEFIKSSQLKKD